VRQNAAPVRDADAVDSWRSAARRAVRVRWSCPRQISSFEGLDCPSRCTIRRRLPFRTTASRIRRTVLRSADHKWSRHLLYSPETEYFDSVRSKIRAPSSSTLARRDPPRNSSRVWPSDSGVMKGFSVQIAQPSVIDEHPDAAFGAAHGYGIMEHSNQPGVWGRA
jgi:hypothetical protein